MAKNKSTNMPTFGSLDELVEFFDTHDMSEYWDQMPGAHFDINIKRRKHLVVIDDEIMVKLTEIVKSKKVLSQKLINSWLKEKISKVSWFPRNKFCSHTLMPRHLVVPSYIASFCY